MKRVLEMPILHNRRFVGCFTPLAIVALMTVPGPAATILLPIDGLDTADVNYNAYSSNLGGGISGISGISDATSLGFGGGGDHFDDAFGVSVNSFPYGVLWGDLTGNTLTLDSVSFGQFDVQVSLQSNGPIMRQIVTATNNGAAGVASIQWHNNTGNDSSQQTIATSDGDLSEETSDNWVVTADNLSGTDNEVNSFIFAGPGGQSPSSLAMVDGSSGFGGFGAQGFNAIFDVAIDSGATSSLLLFLGIEGINEDGIALASLFDDPNSTFFQDLISDLSPSQRSQVVNWNLDGGPAVPEPSSLTVFGLLGALALGGSARRRRQG